MIDAKLKPWLIEVNHLSSFGTDSPLDKKIKFDLIWDTFTLLNMSVNRKKKLKGQRTEQFNKRISKEERFTKETKQQRREKLMAERDEFEGQNLGNFHRVLPC